MNYGKNVKYFLNQILNQNNCSYNTTTIVVIIVITGHVQNPPAFKIPPFKIHPVKFENRLPIEGKG